MLDCFYNTNSKMESEIVLNQVILIEEHRLKWKIDNFTTTKTLKREVRTPFQINSRTGLPYGCEWACSFIRSSGSPYLDTFQIELTKKPNDLKEINCSFRVQIKKHSQGDILYYESKPGSTVNIVDQNLTCRLIGPNFIEHLPLDENGSLQIELLFSLQSPKFKTTDEILNKFKKQFNERLQFDFAKMLNMTPLPCADSATVIVSKVDGTEFPVNRGMLAARSNVFLHMFESKLEQDCFERVVEVADVSSAVLKIILHFLYTGMLLENWNSVKIGELLYAAAKYEVHDLLEFLDVVVGQLCTVENAGKLMNLAKKLGLKRAENELLHFIKRSSERYEQFDKFMEDAKSDEMVEKILGRAANSFCENRKG